MRDRLNRLKDGEHVFIACSDSVADMSVRIFEQGIASDGGKIGEYNKTNPLYINTKKNSPKQVKPQGKPIGGKKGKTKHDNGEPYKTTYFESYADFRSKIGRSSDTVNLSLSGRLQLDFTNGLQKISNNEYVIKLKSKLNANKAKGNEDHFDTTIFNPTKNEEAELLKVVSFESLRIMRGL